MSRNLGGSRKYLPALLLSFGVALTVGGCSSRGFLPISGPNRAEVASVPSSAPLPVQVIDVDDAVARRLSAADKPTSFTEVFGKQDAPAYVVGPGDVVEVSIWEAPPATLFGTTMIDPRAGAGTTRMTTFPEQMVAPDGTIRIPFAGAIPVATQSPQQIEAAITKRLAGKANQPQVLVRVTRNATANVTVVGEVAQSMRMPLTAKGERLLDAVAAAGGVRQPVGKTTIQITRGDRVQLMPLDNVIHDPAQNVRLHPGDIVTALFQPLSFTSLGALSKNEEVFFESQGITLAQALARSGGVQDARADAKGVFIFRFEQPFALEAGTESTPLTPDGKVPVIYRVDLTDPRSFLVAQGFPIRNKDVMYVANAPAAELQKFLNILTSSMYSIRSFESLGR